MTRRVLAVILTFSCFTGMVLFAPSIGGQYQLWRIERLMSMCSQQEAAKLASRLADISVSESDRNPRVLYLLGRLNRRIGNLDQALEQLTLAEKLGFEPAAIRHQRQLALFQRGHLDQSSELNRLLRADLPDDQAYEVYESLAKGYLFSYRFQDAMQLLDFWIQWSTDATDPRIWRAGIWEQTDSWARAVEEYRDILRIDTEHLEARLGLARLLMTRFNKPDEAARELQRGLEVSPNDAACLIGMAACQRQMASGDEAERLLRRVLASGADSSLQISAKRELGQVLLDQQKTEEATALLREVIRITPQDSTAHYALGTALAAEGQHEEAQREFSKSRELVEQYARLSTITQALVNNPANPDLRWEAGEILMKQGLAAEGAAWMSTALMYEPAHQNTHRRLAEYYETVKPDAAMAEHHRSQITSQKE
ncbi:MAG: tetratricopeptide repeat protein [Planctomycetota bacterium]